MVSSKWNATCSFLFPFLFSLLLKELKEKGKNKDETMRAELITLYHVIS